MAIKGKGREVDLLIFGGKTLIWRLTFVVLLVSPPVKCEKYGKINDTRPYIIGGFCTLTPALGVIG